MTPRQRLEVALSLYDHANRIREIGKREPHIQPELDRMADDITRIATEIEAYDQRG